MGKPLTPQRGYRSMTHAEICTLNISECKRGILSCRSAKAIANRYHDEERAQKMDEQIGMFTIQIDMLISGDVCPAH